MTDRIKWDIEQIKQREIDREVGYREKFKKIEEDMKDLWTFKTSTVEKLIMIFQMLEELKEGDKMIKRIFITSLVGGVFSGLSALVVWAIQN